MKRTIVAVLLVLLAVSMSQAAPAPAQRPGSGLFSTFLTFFSSNGFSSFLNWLGISKPEWATTQANASPLPVKSPNTVKIEPPISALPEELPYVNPGIPAPSGKGARNQFEKHQISGNDNGLHRGWVIGKHKGWAKQLTRTEPGNRADNNAPQNKSKGRK